MCQRSLATELSRAGRASPPATQGPFHGIRNDSRAASNQCDGSGQWFHESKRPRRLPSTELANRRNFLKFEASMEFLLLCWPASCKTAACSRSGCCVRQSVLLASFLSITAQGISSMLVCEVCSEGIFNCCDFEVWEELDKDLFRATIAMF